jgi:hypothetical protein
MTAITPAQARRIGELVREAARDRAFNWRWDACHGEVMDPAWARRFADDLEAVTVWAAPDGWLKARTPAGYAAYEMLEGAASRVLDAAQWDTCEMDWRGRDRGVAAIRVTA